MPVAYLVRSCASQNRPPAVSAQRSASTALRLRPKADLSQTHRRLFLVIKGDAAVRFPGVSRTQCQESSGRSWILMDG